MSEERYVIVDPAEHFPGCLGVVAKESKIEKMKEMGLAAVSNRYIGRAILSDHIPLSASLEEILSATSSTLLQINGDPLTIYLQKGKIHGAAFYDFSPKNDKNLAHIDVEIESSNPLNVLAEARTAINQMLDALMKSAWLPLVIIRIDLFLKNDVTEAICHQLIFPFNKGILLGPLGGIHQHPHFSTYESILREAITSNSPYYRFLCAYKLYEGVGELRRWIKSLCHKYSIKSPIPKDPLVDINWLKKIGFKDDFLENVKTVNDLSGKLRALRTSVAHFLNDSIGQPLLFSSGHNFFEFSLSGSVLLHYAHIAVSELAIFFGRELETKINIGMILPMKEQRDNFVIKA